MIINEMDSSNGQPPESDDLVKAEGVDAEMVYAEDQNFGDGESSTAFVNGSNGDVAASEGSPNSASPNNFAFKNEPENGNDAVNFSAFGNSYMDYGEGNNEEDSNEPPELQNATLEASEDPEKEEEDSAYYSAMNGTQVSRTLEAALLSCTGQVPATSAVPAGFTANITPGTQHLITASEMSTMKVSELNNIKSIVVPHNKGNSNMKREWRNVGWFTSEEEMDRVRKSQRVSKWKTVDQINGLKVFFRCNKWKRTSCNYRMYVMYYAMDRISLNESGEHDHSTLNADFKPRPYIKTPCARAVIEATPSSSQQHALDQFILKSSQAFLNNAYEQENVFETKAYDNDSTRTHSRPPSRIIGSSGEIVDGQTYSSYNLSDGQNIGELLQVASDMDLTFSFNSRKHCEYCFESNLPAMKGKVVVFVDFGDRVSVTERHHGMDQMTEDWKKADWKQFLWAVRGKCMNALKNI